MIPEAQDHASKTKGLLWLSLACIIAVVFAAGLSPLAHAIPWSWEKRLGDTLADDSTVRQCRANKTANALLQQMVKRLYPLGPEDGEFSIDVRIVNDSVINAYATLGDHITLNAGLLKHAGSPEEIAGILAHEMEHVRRRHIMEGTLLHLLTAEGVHLILGGDVSTARWANYFLTMNFTRAQEAQADDGGLHRLQNAHVDNRGLNAFFARMERLAPQSRFLSDHPSNADRMDRVSHFTNENTTPIMSNSDWQILKASCETMH